LIFRVGCTEAAFDATVRKMVLTRREVVIGVRPYAVHRTAQGAAAQVVANQWLGDQSHIAASFAGKTIVLVEHDRAALSEGQSIQVQIKPEDLHVFDPATGAALAHGHALVA
jgi:multiple sugar transport system ATP-binding protein